jgi:hypothetical protein
MFCEEKKEKNMRFLGYVTLMFILGALALTACATSGSLEGTLWQVTAYRSVDGEMVESLPDVKTTAQFEGRWQEHQLWTDDVHHDGLPAADDGTRDRLHDRIRHG